MLRKFIADGLLNFKRLDFLYYNFANFYVISTELIWSVKLFIYLYMLIYAYYNFDYLLLSNKKKTIKLNTVQLNY